MRPPTASASIAAGSDAGQRVELTVDLDAQRLERAPRRMPTRAVPGRGRHRGEHEVGELSGGLDRRGRPFADDPLRRSGERTVPRRTLAITWASRSAG